MCQESIIDSVKKDINSQTFSHSFILGCEFPQEWQGEWNLEGERESLQISEEDFGTKGKVIDTKYYKQFANSVYGELEKVLFGQMGACPLVTD